MVLSYHIVRVHDDTATPSVFSGTAAVVQVCHRKQENRTDKNTVAPRPTAASSRNDVHLAIAYHILRSIIVQQCFTERE